MPLTVKDLNPDEQPRERALAYGTASLSTPELWALILRTGTVGNPITQLCRELMNANDGKMHLLMRRSRSELLKIKGLGTTKVIQIEAVMELIKRYQAEVIGERPRITMSKDIWELMRFENGNLNHEEVWVLFLNRRNEVLRKLRVTSGTMNASLFDAKPIIKEALLSDSDGVVLCHNHPSGNLQPSIPDDNITKTLREACKVFDIRLLDHVIVTSDSYYSYRDKGRIL